MTRLQRSDKSILGRWWWTVDKWSFVAIILLIGAGILLIQAASPAVAVKHHLDSFYFVQHHFMLLIPASLIIFTLSFMPVRWIVWLSCALLAIFIPMLWGTLFFGQEIKGSTRWISLLGFSLQPSEFIKPLFIVVSAWLFGRQCERKGFPGASVNFLLLFLILIALIRQPDIGTTFLISGIWVIQYGLAGLSLLSIFFAGLFGIGSLIAFYYTLPHFATRVDKFLGHNQDTYQIDRAMEAFSNGGLMGTGPGNGTVKMSIPDAHADFIFAVAGEELGLICCLMIILLFAFIILRGFWLLIKKDNLFVLVAGAGLLTSFGAQAIINLLSTLNLMPAKGMTLPFISYGGSSLLATSLGMGMLLALTRKRYGADEK